MESICSSRPQISSVAKPPQASQAIWKRSCSYTFPQSRQRLFGLTMLMTSSAPSLLVPSVSTSKAKRSESSIASVISPMDSVTLSTFRAPACSAERFTASMTPVMIPSSCMQPPSERVVAAASQAACRASYSVSMVSQPTCARHDKGEKAPPPAKPAKKKRLRKAPKPFRCWIRFKVASRAGYFFTRSFCFLMRPRKTTRAISSDSS